MEPALSRLNKSAVGYDCILTWVRYAVRKDTPAVTHAAVANLAHKMPAAATSHWVTALSFSCASPLVPPVHSLLPQRLMSSELHCLVYPCTEEQLWAAPWLRYASLSHMGWGLPLSYCQTQRQLSSQLLVIATLCRCLQLRSVAPQFSRVWLFTQLFEQRAGTNR
jgi:hypothetical protein